MTNEPRPARRRITARGVIGVIAVGILAFVLIDSITSDDTGPITYDTCAEANAEAAEWQVRSVNAERDMATMTGPDDDYETAARLFDKALLMQSRIIAGNPGCYPLDIVMQAAEHIGVPIGELPEGPSR